MIINPIEHLPSTHPRSGSSWGCPAHSHVPRLDPRWCGGRSSRRLSPPTGVLCVRGRTCIKRGKSVRRRAADPPRGSGEAAAEDEALWAAPTCTITSGKRLRDCGEGDSRSRGIKDGLEDSERISRAHRYAEFTKEEPAPRAPTSSFR